MFHFFQNKLSSILRLKSETNKKPQTFTNKQPKQQSPAERKLTFLSWKYLIPFLGHF